MIQFEKVSLTDLIVIVALSLGFVAAIINGEKEIASTLGGGLLGYARGAVKTSTKEGANNG
jgi:hypothetical protein